MRSSLINRRVHFLARYLAKQNPNIYPRSLCCTSKNKGSRTTAVPSSQLGRAVTFGGLAAKIGVNTLLEKLKQSDSNKRSGLLSEENLEEVVTTLCKVRGAALKLGQMISLQDDAMFGADVVRVFDRVRQAADAMPSWQSEKVLSTELGPDWRTHFSTFDSTPFAAASIGQVHRGTLLDGREVAVKVQYPGVRDSISSDLSNLLLLAKTLGIIPRGLYVEELVKVLRRELAWECDYRREAAAGDKFRKLVAGHDIFSVPQVITELSAERVLTTEFVNGVSLDRCVELDQDRRNRIGEQIFWLVFSEVFNWKFVQTDPNWSNFLYSYEDDRIHLIDFGASRTYSSRFLDTYLLLLRSAVVEDESKILELSRQLGFLTGLETAQMEKAHIQSVLVLAQVFNDDLFDFGTQMTTRQINDLIPTMVQHRLTAPPEETYSLHRKLAGCFLLCTKLGASVRCGDIFREVTDSYKFSETDGKAV